MKLESEMKGIIALDIDGTLTQRPGELSTVMADFLKKLSKSWVLTFITGRSFTLAWNLLEALDFSYILAVQNGACLLEMPSKDIFCSHYLLATDLFKIEQIAQEEGCDFVIYGGVERDDVCYFRPKNFSLHLLQSLIARCQLTQEVWMKTTNFEELNLKTFPTVKFFGNLSTCEKISQKLERLNLHAPIIKDPFMSGVYLVQGSVANANKGQALRDVKKRLNEKFVVIAAGDDINDHSMLEEADIALVMDKAPSILLEKAQSIILPSSEEGLIEGLKKVTKDTFWRKNARNHRI